MCTSGKGGANVIPDQPHHDDERECSERIEKARGAAHASPVQHSDRRGHPSKDLFLSTSKGAG